MLHKNIAVICTREGIEIKHIIALIGSALLITILSACTLAEDVLEIGEPTIESADNEKGFTIRGSTINEQEYYVKIIREVKVIFENHETTDKPPAITNEEPDIYFHIRNQKQYTFSFATLVWMNSDGTSVLEDGPGFIELNVEETERLRTILE
ncbi:hypothetical protein LCM20_09580 [Halobacillus litoralis]|uniref:hypothetical protein n=1 Tax=Halobacillus litoralis TaxID=45668 RepID=UPI001CD7E034|nr:hypothetical protein [Halobacillus litoralis]MCA0970840.1 hypothetical protein [Halobacillus litoralis]